jgi:signal transduction histidine kinase
MEDKSKIRILVVDDERVVRDGCRRVLSGKGYEVLGAEDGKRALGVLEDEAVDLMLLDLKMPVMGGEEVLEHVRSHRPDIPVIIITGHGTVDNAVECMKRGAYDFVTKPFQVEPFLLTIGRAVDKRRFEQQRLYYEREKERNLYDLSLEKSRLRTIINCMANGVLVTNRNLEVVLHNPALTRLMEIDQEIPPPMELTRLTENPALVETLRKLQSGELPPDGFVSQEIEAGKHVLRAISAPAPAPDDGVVGTVTVLEDITAFKRLDEMKSDFVNMVAHELRSPLVSIRQQHNVILEGLAGPLEDKQADLIRRGVRKIDQLLELINDLLDIARIEAGKHVQHRVPTDVEKVIREAVELIRPRAEDQGVRLSVSCDDARPVQADPKGMAEVFNNLITNAVNYSPGGGRVEVAVQKRGDNLEICVSDNGVGIPPEELPKIWDKFYRVKHPETRQVMGTGLGLAITRGIVESHQGQIDVKSEPARGTTFRILLPMMATDG